MIFSVFALFLALFGVFLMVGGFQDVRDARLPMWRYLQVEGWKSVWLGLIFLFLGAVWM